MIVKVESRTADEYSLTAAIELSDDGFDVPGFVEIRVGDTEPVEVHISELAPAIQAFADKYEAQLRRDAM